MARISATAAGGIQVVAFLEVIAHCEGTAGHGDDGYNILVGGGQFTSYQDHPRQLITLRDKDGNPKHAPDGRILKSTAAGRYQLLAHYFDDYKRLLGLRDFSPLSQDRIAIQQIKERRALPAILAGDLEEAIGSCCNIWASLPGNDYGQRQETMARIAGFFTAAGGKLAKGAEA